MLDIRIEKHAVFADKIDCVRRRVAQLAACPPSPSLVTYTSVHVTPRYLVVAAALSPGGPWERPRRPVAEAEARAIVRGLLRAVYALHARRLVHGHIGVDAVLVSPAGDVLLERHALPVELFSPSSDAGRRVRRCCAPEIWRSSAFDYSADVWAIGATLLQLVAPAGREYDTEDLLEVDIMSPAVTALSPAAVSFAVQCLREETEARPTVAELLMHPFLSDREGSAEGGNTGDEGSGGEGNDDGEDESDEEEDEDEQDESDDDEEDEDEDEDEDGEYKTDSERDICK